MTFRSKISSIASWMALIAVAALLGLGLLALVHRVETLDGALEESQADRRALHSELDEQEAATDAQKAVTEALGQQVERLGGKPVVDPSKSLPPVASGPTAAQIDAAVKECFAAGVCVGKATQAQVNAAVVTYCSTRNGCAGRPGADSDEPGPQGETGPAPTAAQIYQAAAEWCSVDDRCKGEKGDKGDKGDAGDAGPAGRSIESVSCDQGVGTWTFHYSDGTSQTVQCTPSAEPEN